MNTNADDDEEEEKTRRVTRSSHRLTEAIQIRQSCVNVMTFNLSIRVYIPREIEREKKQPTRIPHNMRERRRSDGILI